MECISLETSRTNWELYYNTFEEKSESLPKVVVAVILTTFLYPICLIIGTIIFCSGAHLFCRSVYNQFKLKKILSSDELLKKYNENRITECEKQIEKCKRFAIHYIQKLENPEELQLPIPQRKGFIARLLTKDEEVWKNFSWDAFRKGDFFERLASRKNGDISTLEKLRIRMDRITNQKQQLLALDNQRRMEMIRTIAEFSFIKNAFNKEEAKKFLAFSSIFIIPCGIAFSSYLFSSNDRQTYQGKKAFLPPETRLDRFADLLDAHNQLIKDRPFLVPYLTGELQRTAPSS